MVQSSGSLIVADLALPIPSSSGVGMRRAVRVSSIWPRATAGFVPAARMEASFGGTYAMVALVGITEIGAPPIGGPHTPPGAQGPAPARFGPAAHQIVVPTAKEMIRKASLRMRMAPE